MFVSSEQLESMNPAAFRKSKGWSQAELGKQLGVRSRGYISDLESGKQSWPLKLALKLEQISGREVLASTVCPEAAELLQPMSAQMATAPPPGP